MLLLSCFCTYAQTQSDLNTAGRLLLNKKYKEALPVFQNIMAGSDEALKRRAIDFLTDVWVNNTNEVYMTLSGEVVPYAKLLQDYMNATFAGKESGMNTADHFTAGMVFWALGSAGIKSDVIRALSQFEMAYKGGNKNAALYFAQAYASFKRENPSIPWSEILNAYARGVEATHTIEKLKDFGWHHYTNSNGWMAAKTKPERDTSRLLFFETLNIAGEILPDSLYKMVDYYRYRSFNPTDQDTVLTGHLNGYLANMPAELKAQPAFRKAIAWNYLYQFFYDLAPKTDEIRAAVMKKIKALYANDDKAVVELISQFLNEANTNAFGYAYGMQSKWLQYFSPVKVNDADAFYRAVAMSDQDITAFGEANGPISDHVRALAEGYQRRLYVLHAIITSGALNERAKSAMGQTATSENIAVLKKLLAMPALKNNSDLKHIYADMAVLNNFAYALNFGQVPVQIGELPGVFAGWTAADKSSYEAVYFNQLAAILNKIKTSAPVSDLDYGRLTDAMKKLAAVFK